MHEIEPWPMRLFDTATPLQFEVRERYASCMHVRRIVSKMHVQGVPHFGAAFWNLSVAARCVFALLDL